VSERTDGAALRVLIVDDHPMFRMGLSAALADMDGIELVGQAERAEEVESLVDAARPDIVLLDVRLPDGSGLEVNRRLAERHPQVKVVLLTMSEDQETVLTALRDGARGYLVKGTGPDRVEHALRSVAAGDVVLNQELARSVSELAEARSRATRNRPFPALTDRELDVLALMAEGLDNQTIARRLVLSPKTVRNHVSNVLTKIHAGDRSQAIVLARQAGLGGETR
jgi:DNA-binding NarL/FixJ family response regulator